MGSADYASLMSKMNASLALECHHLSVHTSSTELTEREQGSAPCPGSIVAAMALF